MRYFVTITVFLLLSASMAFGGIIKGVIKDAQTKSPLVGANVLIVGTAMGSTTDEDGFFMIKDVPEGEYVLQVDYLGYQQYEQAITMGADDISLDVELASVSLVSEAINIVSFRAKSRETPVAFSDVDKERIVQELGSRDIPLVLNTTPSVYATQQGGGAGDARVNVRGFNQRNVAIMINGVPVNDMENGWVYWSNWDGVGDATASIQVQRGLSAVNLATPSIGGTMNVITDPTAAKAGGKFRQEFGDGSFLKSTITLNTGLIDDKYAVSAVVVRKLGDGIIDATWTDAWAYYFGASYNINKFNRLEFYALGAPQRHGQNLYKQNIGAYDHEFAKSIDGYDPAALEKFTESPAGRDYNENWNTVSSSYSAQQGAGSNTFDRHDEGFINERENFFHKPQVNLNWYSQLSNTLNLYNIIYYSGGRGGGTGTRGSIKWDYSGPSRIADWDATIARNDTSSTGSTGILRNSRNNQWTIGAISKLVLQVNDQVKTTVGVDWRTAEIDHFREVRDLLGGDYYIPSAGDQSEFWSESEKQRGLGDKMGYYNTNTVDWLGGFGQLEYNNGTITGYGMAGYSTIKYSFTDHFKKDENGAEVFTETDNIGGYQVKGGLGYNLSPQAQVYGNAGYVSKVPIFDQVIDDRTGTKSEDPKNEKFISLEAGVNLRLIENKLNLKAGIYNTQWNDRSNSIGIRNADNSEAIIFLAGTDALHRGLELESDFRPNQFLRIDAAASFGNWKYTDDVTGIYKDYSVTGNQDTAQYFIDNLKVGDAPQTQITLGLSVFPAEGFFLQASVRNYSNHFADFEPFGRTDPDDRVQSWKTPSYTLIDLHASYDLPVNIGNLNPTFFVHVFNLLDEVYVQDAVDNSRFNAYTDNGKTHSADDAEVFLGLPRYINAGLQINF